MYAILKEIIYITIRRSVLLNHSYWFIVIELHGGRNKFYPLLIDFQENLKLFSHHTPMVSAEFHKNVLVDLK